MIVVEAVLGPRLARAALCCALEPAT